MACYSPLRAYKQDGAVVFYEAKKHDQAIELQLACGQCVGCRMERSRIWATRCVHEASMHKENAFITLTYSDEHRPPGNNLVYRDFQLFMKRLRKSKAAQQGKIRFYAAGEYGTDFGRPHFHACLFGHDFADKKFWKNTESNSKIYRSEQLETLWPWGYSSTADVTFESAAYVARYIMKKQTGKQAAEHYRVVEKTTGEIIERTPEFNKMSLKPGIGAGWLERYETDVYPEGKITMRGGITMKTPKYYDKIYKKNNKEKYEEIEKNREEKQMEQQIKGENYPDRLEVKKQVQEAKLKQLKRKI